MPTHRFTARRIDTGEPATYAAAGGRIACVDPAEAASNLPWVAPAFIDHQVNGYMGHDLNGSQPPTAATVAALTRAVWRTGVARYCPTLITHSEAHILHALRAIVAACDADPLVDASIACVHVEGPFISPEDGPRGAHNPKYVRPPDFDEFLRWQEAARGRIGIVTLSPEWPGALQFIERLAALGVVPAIGHTAASPQQIRDAVRAGCRLSTHLGNGSHSVLPRHDNYLWEQMACDELWAGLILDGHHLPPAVAKCILRAKGVQRAVLTSDAVAPAGLPPGRYELNGIAVELTPAGRIEVVDGGGVLAGSACDMPVGVQNAQRFAGLTLSEAVSLATLRPAELLDLPDPTLRPGARADVVLFDSDPETYELRIIATMVAGTWVYGEPPEGLASG